MTNLDYLLSLLKNYLYMRNSAYLHGLCTWAEVENARLAMRSAYLYNYHHREEK